jgi:hypothetical protein
MLIIALEQSQVTFLSTCQTLLFNVTKAKLNGIVAIRVFVFDLCHITWTSLDNGDWRNSANLIYYLGHAHFYA